MLELKSQFTALLVYVISCDTKAKITIFTLKAIAIVICSLFPARESSHHDTSNPFLASNPLKFLSLSTPVLKFPLKSDHHAHSVQFLLFRGTPVQTDSTIGIVFMEVNDTLPQLASLSTHVCPV